MSRVKTKSNRVGAAQAAVRPHAVKGLKAAPAKAPRPSPLRDHRRESSQRANAAQAEIARVWKRYCVVRGCAEHAKEREELRNRLIENYQPIVRFTAERMRTRLPSEVEVDDLFSAGVFGLMDAINSFDPSRGIKFETFCPQRIRGAIFDELRQMDWVPRLVRSRTSRMERVRKQIEMEKGRPATNAELRARLDVSEEEFEKIHRDSSPIGLVSLNKKWSDADSGNEAREIDVPQDDTGCDAFSMLQRQDMQTLITRGLSRAERLIVILYYYEELTMKEIGLTLDLSESRVSQMHSSILARLKAQMKHRLREMTEE